MKNIIIFSVSILVTFIFAGCEYSFMDPTKGVGNLTSKRNFLETFNNAPDYTNNWTKTQDIGTNSYAYTANNLSLSSYTASGSSVITLRTNALFTGSDIDYAVELNHGGYGRSLIIIWDDNDLTDTGYIAGFFLDTNDIPYLGMMVWEKYHSSGSDWYDYLTHPGAPYMNTWVTLRIVISNLKVNFFVNDSLWASTNLKTAVTSQHLGLSVGYADWKSLPNNTTSFRKVTVNVQ